MYSGTVADFRKSFGFIWCRELNRRIFFHIANLNAPQIAVGVKVEFELGPGRLGKPDEAIKVTPIALDIATGADALKAVTQ